MDSCYWGVGVGLACLLLEWNQGWSHNAPCSWRRALQVIAEPPTWASILRIVWILKLTQIEVLKYLFAFHRIDHKWECKFFKVYLSKYGVQLECYSQSFNQGQAYLCTWPHDFSLQLLETFTCRKTQDLMLNIEVWRYLTSCACVFSAWNRQLILGHSCKLFQLCEIHFMLYYLIKTGLFIPFKSPPKRCFTVQRPRVVIY